MEIYDVVVVGAGLGGLVCGAVLSREGMKVLVVEQHRIAGGCLQSFRRHGRLLDTGMHYIGSMREGQIMHQYFRYLKVLDALKFRMLDEEGFEVIRLSDGREYRHAMGYDRFIGRLADDFPAERDGLRRYCAILQDIGRLISPEMLRQGRISDFEACMKYMSLPAAATIDECVKDPALRSVLAATNGLYAGSRATTSLYEHGIINNSNIEGACSFTGGSQQLADALVAAIRSAGGEVRTSAPVAKIHAEGAAVQYVGLRDGERIHARHVISSIHPAATLDLLENNTVIRRSFFTRIRALPNTYGLFTTYLLLRPGALPCDGRNRWFFNTEDVWAVDKGRYKGVDLPFVLAVGQPDPRDGSTEVMTLMTPMPRRLWERWADTSTGRRGAGYEAFKEQYAAAMTDFVCERMPQLRGAVEAVHTSSPLTYRDFTGTPDGSAYGIVKDFHNPLVSILPVQTKIPNLLLTGQSINIHGCLGTTISAVSTCCKLLGTEYLTKKIGHA